MWHRRHCEFLEKWVFSWRREGARTKWSVRPDAGESCQKGGRLPEEDSEELTFLSPVSPTSEARLLGTASRVAFISVTRLILYCGETSPHYNPFLPVPCDISQLGGSHICHFCHLWLMHHIFFSRWVLTMVVILLWSVWPSKPSFLFRLCTQEVCCDG